MIDFNRWIYSKDIAAWLEQNVSFHLEEQMAYSCSALHRTLEEKLDGLRKLYDESKEKIVSDRMKDLDVLYRRSCQDVSEENCLFQPEILFAQNTCYKQEDQNCSYAEMPDSSFLFKELTGKFRIRPARLSRWKKILFFLL